MARLDPTVANCGETVMVSRDGFGDWKRAPVPVAELTGACIAVARGGDWEWLPEPAPAVYVPARLFPLEYRSKKHPEGRGNMLLMMEPDGTDPQVYSWVVEEAGKNVHTREYVEHLRAKLERRRARARGEES
jgi:hypothetical protein